MKNNKKFDFDEILIYENDTQTQSFQPDLFRNEICKFLELPKTAFLSYVIEKFNDYFKDQNKMAIYKIHTK